jgi:uncharacterized membrane protein YhhN
MTSMILYAGFAVIALILLVYFEGQIRRTGVLITKPLLSLMFVIAACLQPQPFPAYATAVLLGLCACLLGDVFLIFSSDRLFLFGLIAFLAGHLFYAWAFYSLGTLNMGTIIGAAVFLVVGVPIFLWLRPYLGKMRTPVLIYVVVITVMVVGAATVMGDPRLACGGRILVLAGAMLFYLSDVFVARQKFVNTHPVNRIVGLPLYYLGQFLLALSIGQLGQ